MDEIKDSQNKPEPNPLMDNATPKYLDERPQLDRKIQQQIRAYSLRNKSFMPQFFRLVVPLLLLVTGERMWDYHKDGGETPVNTLLVISMVAIGGFYTLMYLFKLIRESIPIIKRTFFKYEGEELGHEHDAPPTPEDIENEITHLLSLPGAPSFENYKDSRAHEGKLVEYVHLVNSHSNLERMYLILGLNASLILGIPDLFMGIFFSEMNSVGFLVGMGIIFAYSSFMYFKTYQKCSEFFYEMVPVASYTLIEYSIFRNLWDNKSRNII